MEKGGGKREESASLTSGHFAKELIGYGKRSRGQTLVTSVSQGETVTRDRLLSQLSGEKEKNLLLKRF